MPDISGLDFLKSVKNHPCIIFTTAYSEFALEGYEYNSVDYLLKPFSFERFLKAVNKGHELIKDRYKPEGVPIGKKDQYLCGDHISVRADRKLYRIALDDIYFIEGGGAYVTFHLKGKNITALMSMKELDLLLPPAYFIRVHKSFIVAINQIITLEGNQIVAGGIKIPVGRNYRSGLENLFTNQNKS